jgi:hypothetical protein
MNKDTVLSAVAAKVAAEGRAVLVTSPLIFEGMGTAVTPVLAVLTLMAYPITYSAVGQ